MYGIDGRDTLKEEILGHWEGYRGSRPVRIGNAAYQQLQMDIFGELMDAVYLYNKYGSPISSALWRDLRRLADWVCDNWQRRDNGIWEVRSGPQHFVYSKMMCWVALDRALRLAAKRSFPADLHRWAKTRDRIYEQVLRKGWNPRRGAFVQHYGGNDAGRILPHDATRVFYVPDRPQDDPNPRRHLPAILPGGIAVGWRRLPL